MRIPQRVWGMGIVMVFVVPLTLSAATTDFQIEIFGFECFDGNDNDGDGFIDFPADPDCEAQNDDTEAVPVVVVPEEPVPLGGGLIPAPVPPTPAPLGETPAEEDIARITITPLPVLERGDAAITAQPVLLPPDSEGNPFNPQPVPSAVVQPPVPSSAFVAEYRPLSVAEAIAAGGQPLLPILEIYMEPRGVTTSSAELGIDALSGDVPIHSPHSPLLPLFSLVGAFISILSIARIVLIML